MYSEEQELNQLSISSSMKCFPQKLEHWPLELLNQDFYYQGSPTITIGHMTNNQVWCYCKQCEIRMSFFEADFFFEEFKKEPTKNGIYDEFKLFYLEFTELRLCVCFSSVKITIFRLHFSQSKWRKKIIIFSCQITSKTWRTSNWSLWIHSSSSTSGIPNNLV